MSDYNDNNKYELGICELFHKKIHGFDSNSSKSINGNFIVNSTYELSEFYNNEYKNDLDNIRSEFYHNYSNANFKHSLIRNFNTIIRKENYYKLDIIEIKILEGGEQIGIIKTFWLKLVQRKWKNIYNKRQQIIKKRKHPYALINRQYYGKWHNNINYIFY